jgi:hypothetical protein
MGSDGGVILKKKFLVNKKIYKKELGQEWFDKAMLDQEFLDG